MYQVFGVKYHIMRTSNGLHIIRNAKHLIPNINRQAVNGQTGYIMLMALVMGLVLSMLGLIGTQILINNMRFTKFEERQSRALDVAEAGINYYLWHLAHNPSDYQDGTSLPAAAPFGPYTHNYYDNDGNLIGAYTLTVTPPTNGSTVTTVKSLGTVPNMGGGRTILAQLGQPSFSNYIFLSNTELVFSATSTTTGPVHSNVGVDFNGTNNGPVTAARTTYTSGVDGASHTGVWGTGGPKSQWQYPVPAVDFNKVTVNLSDMQTQSQPSNGGVNLGTSGGAGWYLQLKSGSPASFDVYKVSSESTTGITKTFIRTQAVPTDGIVFSPETVWIAGTGFTGRMTVVAAYLPDTASKRRSINVIGDLTYAASDGTAAIGLVAQQDVFIPRYVPSTMTVNAAVLAQYGSVGYDTANGGLKTAFTLYGAIAQNQNAYGFKTTGCSPYCTGFPTTSYNFDSHLIYAPPPSFPTTGNYSVLNWREQLFSP